MEMAKATGSPVYASAISGAEYPFKPLEDGTAIPVGEAIVDSLFPPKDNGRIPIVAVTGVNGKTTVTRFIAHVLRGTAPTTGDAVRVRWVRRLRAEQKFADLAALQAQIAKDSDQAKQALGLLG